jgi:hypothetical protein
VERVRGIEPPYSAWEADVLPLNYTRELAGVYLWFARPLQFRRLTAPQTAMSNPTARSQYARPALNSPDSPSGVLPRLCWMMA